MQSFLSLRLLFFFLIRFDKPVFNPTYSWWKKRKIYVFLKGISTKWNVNSLASGIWNRAAELISNGGNSFTTHTSSIQKGKKVGACSWYLFMQPTEIHKVVLQIPH